MDDVKLRGELVDCFGIAVSSDQRLMGECENLCQMFNLAANDLLYKWEAFNYNDRQTSFSDITMDSVQALRAQLQRELTLQNNRKQRTQLGILLRGHAAQSVGTQVNTQAPEDYRSVSSSNAILFRGPKNNKASCEERAFKYMFERISDRSEALDNRIDEMAEILRDHYKISEFGDPASFSEDCITVVGRISRASESTKLHETSLVLESSRMMGSGARVPLRFAPQVKIRGGVKGAGGIGIFPGAIIALRGKNGGGGWFMANEVLALPLPSSLGRRVTLENNTSFSMCIASGPYTSGTDLKYKPWHKLLGNIISATPNVVLLLGPFVDCANIQLKHGNLDQSAGSLFQEQFMENLHRFLDVSPNSIVLLVPSVRDMISDHAVFPQCEFGVDLSSDPRIHLLPNPCQFSLNGIAFAVTSVDVLFHLRTEEFFQQGQEIQPILDDHANDAMANLCRHLLEQRSFYPLFPVPDDCSHDINLDISHSRALKLGDVTDHSAPNVLIVPSKLKHFSKTIHNTVAINPSSVVKGTYSELIFGSKGNGHLRDQLRVEMIKQCNV